MQAIRTITAAALLASGLTAAAPASAVITTFANYTAVSGANVYWQRTGTNFVAATTASVIASGVVPKPILLPTTSTKRNPLTPAQIAANKTANTAATKAYDNAVAAQIPIQTAASAAAAQATAGGEFFSIRTASDTTPGAVATKFTFQSPTAKNPLRALAQLGQLNAALTLSATAKPGTPAQSAFGLDIQQLTSGSFSFIYTGTADLLVHHTVYHTGANLLSATLTPNGNLYGLVSGTSGSITGSTSGGNTIVYSSDFLNFSLATEKDLSLSLASITPPLGFTTNQALNTFFATSGGSFSTDPAPGIIAIIPEPGIWVLMIAGFAMVGASARRRSIATAA